jgi:hypothetical protein
MSGSDSKEPAQPDYKSPRVDRLERAAIAVMMIVGVVGLTWLACHVSNPERGVAAEDRPGMGNIVRSEASGIFIPAAIEDLAKYRLEVAAIESHDDVKAWLQRRRMEKVWYAVVYRAVQANGRVVVMPTYCRPFETSSRTWEFRAVLAAVQGSPPLRPTDYSTAMIYLIPEDLATADPGNVINELMQRWDIAESQQSP